MVRLGRRTVPVRARPASALALGSVANCNLITLTGLEFTEGCASSLRRSLKNNVGLRRKDKAIPHCAAAKPRSTEPDDRGVSHHSNRGYVFEWPTAYS